jgi:hypothetical protein
MLRKAIGVVAGLLFVAGIAFAAPAQEAEAHAPNPGVFDTCLYIKNATGFNAWRVYTPDISYIHYLGHHIIRCAFAYGTNPTTVCVWHDQERNVTDGWHYGTILGPNGTGGCW